MVLINGAGGAVGLNGIEICKALGCKVIGVAGGHAGLELIAKKGAIAIDYKEPDLVKKLQVSPRRQCPVQCHFCMDAFCRKPLD